ncbi:MAG: hypothetical protein K0041_09585, partial [Acidithiobacillus sp.]|nr:hypothetical protein [Acidithiobacillus sp.]
FVGHNIIPENSDHYDSLYFLQIPMLGGDYGFVDYGKGAAVSMPTVASAFSAESREKNRQSRDACVKFMLVLQLLRITSLPCHKTVIDCS